VANLSHRFVEGTDWEFSDFSLYDLGQAVAHMTIQAEALGLAARQFRAFDQAGLTAEFEVPSHWEISTMAAYGRPARAPEPAQGGDRGEHGDRTADGEPAASPERDRRPLDELVWPVS
jgi:hypothetical protein